MKLVLLLVALTAVYTANCRDQDSNIEALLFPDEPANTDITGEDQLFPNEQVDDASIGETQRVLIGQENQNIDEEVQQMKVVHLNYEMGSVSDYRSSMTKERKRCIPTISCTSAGGHCVKKSGDCKGTVDRYGCRGSKKCKCCIPDDIICIPVQTTAAPKTTRDTTTTTTPTTTTAAPTTTTTDTTTTTTPTTTTAAPTTTTTDTTTTTTPTTTTAATTTTTTDTTTTTPTTTTAAPTTTITECPGGFMMMNQCFRIFNDTTRSWKDAESKCRSENLILAEPSDSVAAPLREYVLKNYGTGNYECWLGARGDGSKFVWQHSGRSLLSNNTLWDYKTMLTSNCLELDVLQNQWASKPGKPYDSVSCANYKWTLCEGSRLSSNLNWLTVGADRFVKYNQTMTWTDARTVCKSVGLDLYQPKDYLAVSKYLETNYFSGSRNIQFWLGGHGNGTHQLWFSGSVVPANAPWFSNYANSVGTNHCMLLFACGGFADRGTVLGAYNCLDTTQMRPLCG